jgi:hypothetical protein
MKSKCILYTKCEFYDKIWSMNEYIPPAVTIDGVIFRLVNGRMQASGAFLEVTYIKTKRVARR